MKRSISLQCDGSWRQALPCVLAPRAGAFRRHRRQHIVLTKLHKDDGHSSHPTTESHPGVPSVIRRTALLGAAAPCLCALCGGGAARAAGRNPLYDRYFATVMRYGMEDYEAIIRPIKSQLFCELVQALLARNGGGGAAAAAAAPPGAAAQPRRVLEVGIGAGPNFPFYTAALAQSAVAAEPYGQQQQQEPLEAAAAVAGARLQIVGLDPNAEMLRFAGDAAKAAGLQLRANDGGGGRSGSGLIPSVGGSDSLGRESSSGGSSSGGGGGTAVSLSGTATAEVSLVQGSAEALPFGDGEFDAAVVTLVMCSVPSPDKALTELRRVVRAGGRLLVIEHVAAGEGRQGLRLAQSLLTPLQRLVADGCSLNRDTAAALQAAGWHTGELHSFDLEGLSILAPHIAGVLVR